MLLFELLLLLLELDDLFRLDDDLPLGLSPFRLYLWSLLGFVLCSDSDDADLLLGPLGSVGRVFRLESRSRHLSGDLFLLRLGLRHSLALFKLPMPLLQAVKACVVISRTFEITVSLFYPRLLYNNSLSIKLAVVHRSYSFFGVAIVLIQLHA